MDAIDFIVDWDEYPKLAAIFQDRPRNNVYWEELARFVTQYAPRGFRDDAPDED